MGGEGEAAGSGGDASHRVPTGDVLCTVKGCSRRAKQSTIFHCHRFKAEEEKDNGEQQKRNIKNRSVWVKIRALWSRAKAGIHSVQEL